MSYENPTPEEQIADFARIIRNQLRNQEREYFTESPDYTNPLLTRLVDEDYLVKRVDAGDETPGWKRYFWTSKSNKILQKVLEKQDEVVQNFVRDLYAELNPSASTPKK